MQKKLAAQLAAIWGFEFPEDLFHVWKVARAIDPKRPCDALLDSIGVRLEGPFQVLAGGKVGPDRGRWPSDPPEFFTIAAGDTDGLHWGYIVHEPGKSVPVCGYFYSRDSPEISIDGTLYASLQRWLSDVRRERQQQLDKSIALGERDADEAKAIRTLDRQIALFDKHAPKTRARPKLPKSVATALDTLAIACTKNQYESPYGVQRRNLVAELRDPSKRPKHIARAREMLQRGKPGGALHVARDLYFALPERDQGVAAALLREVYAALSRPVLAGALGHIAVPDAEANATAKPKGKPESKPKQLQCGSLEEALEDLGAVESLAITYHSPSRETPTPEQFRAMKRLRHLTLRGCTIKELAIEQAPLETLELFECEVPSFPRAIAKLKKLEELTLHALKKPIPKDLALPNVAQLRISDADLATVPPFVLGARKLRILTLSKNRLREIPDELGGLRELSYLRLADNRIEELPDVFDRLPNLSTLWLSKNRLRRLPDSLGKLRAKLKTLDLRDNPLTKDAAERARIKAILPKTKIMWA